MFYFEKNKQKALELPKQKMNNEIKSTYNEISNRTGYSRMQLSRLSTEIEKRDINSMLVHGLTAKPSNNSPSTKEVEFIKNFKNQYPVVSIAQFMDIYYEDVLFLILYINNKDGFLLSNIKILLKNMLLIP